MKLDDVLVERGRTHGDFGGNARMSQAMKELFRREKGWERLGAVQREALDNIAQKIARVLNGDPNCVEHWIDVAGYAQLVVRELDRQEENARCPTNLKR